MGIIISHSKVAERITELAGKCATCCSTCWLRTVIESCSELLFWIGNPSAQIELLRKKTEGGGEMSLQNSLLIAQRVLSYVRIVCAAVKIVLIALDCQ